MSTYGCTDVRNHGDSLDVIWDYKSSFTEHCLFLYKETVQSLLLEVCANEQVYRFSYNRPPTLPYGTSLRKGAITVLRLS